MAINGKNGRRNGDDNSFDDDYDGNPGNSFQSPSYARRYDPRGEYTNLPELPTQLRELNEKEDRERAQRRERIDAQASVHYNQQFGKFIIPTENTWAAHAEIVCDNQTQLAFNPSKYPVFDKIIAERSGLRQLYDPSHPDFEKFEGLRTNLEVLRNDIIGFYLKDGSFDPGDERFIPQITSIAESIGDALRHDRLGMRILTPSIDKDVANVTGVGAAEIYKFLLRQQTPSLGAFNTLAANVRDLLNVPNHSWGLPPIEQTPFSPAGLSAPPPRCGPEVAPQELPRAAATNGDDAFDSLIDSSHDMLDIAHGLRAPESLDIATRKDSVEEARTILRWLRNLKGSGQDMEQWMRTGTLPEQQAKADALRRLLCIYAGELKTAAKQNPGIVNHYLVESANHAAGSLAESVALHTLDSLPPRHPRMGALDRALDGAPPEWECRSGQSVDCLVDSLESALSQISRKPLNDRPIIDRLLDVSERITQNAKKLRSVDTLEPSAREESLELAREILRRLRNMKFSNKPMEEAIDTGKPEEKLAFAQKISELIASYKNLLSEAAMHNPNIFNDARIKAANEAIGKLTHSIKLLAAKELPSSSAAAMQISADISQMPDEWKNLDGRTVDRLLEKVDDGLERAIDDIMLEQQEQQNLQDEHTADKTEEQLLANSLHGRRRKRRRSSSGGGGGIRSVRAAGDSNNDGINDAQQGIRRPRGGDMNGNGVPDGMEGKSTARRPTLGDLDGNGIPDGLQAEIAMIGSAMRASNRQAAALAASPEATAAVNDQSFADRAKDQQTNPRNKQRPLIG